MIKAIIFDIDNTMYSFDRAHKAAMTALGAYVKENFDMKPAEMADLMKKCADIVTERTGDNCAALHNRLLRFQCFLEQIDSTEYQKAMEMYHVYWDTILEVMEPEPGLVPLLSRLKARGIRLGVGSDMTPPFRRHSISGRWNSPAPIRCFTLTSSACFFPSAKPC